MAYHFSANQYEDQYNPQKLGNWEYPKWYPERPRQRFKSTKIIADDCGRLLEGIKGENPWGNYKGTWDLPKRITREYVKQLVAPPERLVNLWEKKKKGPPVQPAAEEATENKEEKTDSLPTLDQFQDSSAQKNFQRRNKSCSALDLRPRSTKLEPLVNLQQKKEDVRSIKPGSLDEKIKNILDSVQEKEKKASPPDVICKEIRALPRRIRQKPETNRRERESKENYDNYGFLKCLDEHLAKFESVPEDAEEEEKEPEIDWTQYENADVEKDGQEMKTSDSPKTSEPPKNGNVDFRIAKRFHDENLRHKPLPDVIDDPVFKALTSGRQTHPGGGLDVEPMPSAIGWKPYTAPRPTECSKLKVYRPKTAVEKVKPQKEGRPKTGSATFKKNFLPIDLAICWDLKPEDPSEEPKRSPHIDGSNGSVAPAVFTMIRPSEAEEQNISGSSQAVAERITRGIHDDNVATLPTQMNGKTRSPMSILSNREAIMSCRKYPQEKQKTPDSVNSISPNAAEFARKNPKTAWTNEDTSKLLSDRLQYLQKESGTKNGSPIRFSSDSSQMIKKKHHQSTPNLTTVCDGSHCGTEKSSPGSVKTSNSSKTQDKFECKKTMERLKPEKRGENKTRNCSACKNSNSDSEEIREKSEFKSAFKAGVPKSESSHSGSSSNAKSYKVPKMRLPYAKRSYSIGTLAPPFSLWRESHGQEYPEHWRLASVYQHSYKPINTRKRPLLASVYQ